MQLKRYYTNTQSQKIHRSKPTTSLMKNDCVCCRGWLTVKRPCSEQGEVKVGRVRINKSEQIIYVRWGEAILSTGQSTFHYGKLNVFYIKIHAVTLINMHRIINICHLVWSCIWFSNYQGLSSVKSFGGNENIFRSSLEKKLVIFINYYNCDGKNMRKLWVSYQRV